MARGSDAKDAKKELKDKYGTGGNAEDLIEAGKQNYPRELRTALLTPVDPTATAALDRAAVEKAAKVTVVGEPTVRGENVVYLAEASDGRRTKQFLPLSALTTSARRKAKG